MSKHKTRGRKANPTGRNDDIQYVKFPYSQLRSPAWRSLSPGAVKLFLELRTRYNGGNNGKLFMSLDEASRVLGMGKGTVQRAYKELEQKGWIIKTKQGSWYGRQATEWRLTETMHNGLPPTHEWKNWTPLKKTEPRSQSGTVVAHDGTA